MKRGFIPVATIVIVGLVSVVVAGGGYAVYKYSEVSREKADIEAQLIVQKDEEIQHLKDQVDEAQAKTEQKIAEAEETQKEIELAKAEAAIKELENLKKTSAGIDTQKGEIFFEPVPETDHLRGNPNAPIVIIEYADYDCPFCLNFHTTMKKIMENYGASGQVSWVFRHFPLEQLHPNAPYIAEASECVSELGGNTAFWKFTDLVFESRNVNEATDINKLDDLAVSAGVDKNQFESCLGSNTYAEKIQNSVNAAISAGARGTPYSLIVVGNHSGVINGAQPYETVRQMIEVVLGQLE